MTATESNAAVSALAALKAQGYELDGDDEQGLLGGYVVHLRIPGTRRFARIGPRFTRTFTIDDRGRLVDCITRENGAVK